MKRINNYINEKLKINKKQKPEYTLFPLTKKELLEMIEQEINQNGSECSLNHIDVSKITSMSNVFANSKFNGDISGWDVGKCEDMAAMFWNSQFDGDISDWNVSNVKSMSHMFYSSKFNQNISKWDVSNVEHMEGMFEISKFSRNISKWVINKNCKIKSMFANCFIKDKYKPQGIQ